MPAERLLGLDIGGTRCAAVIGDETGAIHDRREWPSGVERGPAAMLDDLVAQAHALLAVHEVRAAGVAIGGPLDAQRGLVLGPPNLPGWDHVPLREHLSAALDLPVQLEHDAIACALAEARWGAGRAARSLVYLTCGTGFGAGIVVDGRPLRGAAGHPSDLGHIALTPDGPLGYGRAGSAEGWCAGSALGRIATWLYPQRWPQPADSSQIAELAAAGDPDAQQVIAANAEQVGAVCALLGDVIYPERILLGSLARYLGASWVEQVRVAFRARAHPDAARLVGIEAAGLGKRLQDCSAVAAALGALTG